MEHLKYIEGDAERRRQTLQELRDIQNDARTFSKKNKENNE